MKKTLIFSIVAFLLGVIVALAIALPVTLLKGDEKTPGEPPTKTVTIKMVNELDSTEINHWFTKVDDVATLHNAETPEETMTFSFDAEANKVVYFAFAPETDRNYEPGMYYLTGSFEIDKEVCHDIGLTDIEFACVEHSGEEYTEAEFESAITNADWEQEDGGNMYVGNNYLVLLKITVKEEVDATITLPLRGYADFQNVAE